MQCMVVIQRCMSAEASVCVKLSMALCVFMCHLRIHRLQSLLLCLNYHVFLQDFLWNMKQFYLMMQTAENNCRVGLCLLT